MKITREQRMQGKIHFLRRKVLLMGESGLLSPEEAAAISARQERQFARALGGERRMGDFRELDVYLNAILKSGFPASQAESRKKIAELRATIVKELGRTSLYL